MRWLTCRCPGAFSFDGVALIQDLPNPFLPNATDPGNAATIPPPATTGGPGGGEGPPPAPVTPIPAVGTPFPDIPPSPYKVPPEASTGNASLEKLLRLFTS
jgi:hypothetical protein